MKTLIMLFSASFLILNSSCSKCDDCFDQQLYNQYKNSFCTADCPGVTACNGKTYCNECEAKRNGYRLK